MSKKMELVYLTQTGLEKLQTELEYLKTEKRLEIANKLKEAISYGDLSENSEYDDARIEQSQVENRIIELEGQLKRVEIIDEEHLKEDKVSIGTEVTIKNLTKKEEGTATYKIVGTAEANILEKLPKISNISPVGKALLGKKKGDKVKVKTLSGIDEYQITKMK